MSWTLIQTVCGWEGLEGGLLSCVGGHILQEINTLFLTRYRPYKIATPIEGLMPAELAKQNSYTTLTKITSKDDI
jgi:hypothetical protein